MVGSVAIVIATLGLQRAARTPPGCVGHPHSWANENECATGFTLKEVDSTHCGIGAFFPCYECCANVPSSPAAPASPPPSSPVPLPPKPSSPPPPPPPPLPPKSPVDARFATCRRAARPSTPCHLKYADAPCPVAPSSRRVVWSSIQEALVAPIVYVFGLLLVAVLLLSVYIAKKCFPAGTAEVEPVAPTSPETSKEDEEGAPPPLFNPMAWFVALSAPLGCSGKAGKSHPNDAEQLL